MTMASGEIQERASFERIRYANVWEDADVLCRALEPRRRSTGPSC